MPEPTINEQELAARYGFAMAVLNSNPELKALFQRAVAQTYTPERFQAELRGTQWYQKTAENARNAQILRNTDPESYKSNVEQLRVKVSMMAAELGAKVTFNQGDLGGMINHMYHFGWDDNQIRQWMGQFVQYTDGRLLGQAGQWESQLREYAGQMGVSLSDDSILTYVRSAVSGQSTINDALSKIKQMAASAFPHLSDRIAQGETVESIADPYRQTMATLLEQPANSIGLNDPTIKRALQSTDKDGKPALRTLYDFENDLRKDARWRKTKNAQDQGVATATKVLRDLGVMA